MFIVTLLSGSLATRLKENAKQSAHTAYRTKILFETNQLLQKEQDENAVITATAGQLMKLLKKDIVVYLSDGKELATPNVFRAVNSIQEDLISENEKAVADWAFRNNKHAGATTDTLSSAKCLYLAIRVNQNVYGVAGIAVNGTPLDSFATSLITNNYYISTRVDNLTGIYVDNSDNYYTDVRPAFSSTLLPGRWFWEIHQK